MFDNCSFTLRLFNIRLQYVVLQLYSLRLYKGVQIVMKKITLAVIFSAVMVTGCAKQTFTMGEQPTLNQPTIEKSQPFFVSGIGQKKTIDAAKICGGAENIEKVEVQQTFFNGFLSTITFGIYTPREARVYCK